MKKRIISGLGLGLFLFASPAASGQSPALQDTVQTPHTSFVHRTGDSLHTWLSEPLPTKPLRWQNVAVPAVLLGYGAVSVSTNWLREVDLTGRRLSGNNEIRNHRTSIDDFTEYAPAAAVPILHLAGVRGQNNFVDVAFIGALSYGIQHVLTVPTKRYAARLRPDGSDLLSFPSGHTATAFVSAEILRQEYGSISPWIGVGGYVVAAFTGYLRMYNNKHWFSDVVTGAGVGILSTRLAYWVYPKIKNAILGKSNLPSRTMILPTWQNGGYGLCLVHRF